MTQPLISALVVSASLASCQRKAEEPVVSPGTGRGQVWFEVSERPMGGETKAAPATIETFTTSHESFGVVGYAYESGSPSKTKDASGTMEVKYVPGRNRWEPENPVKYSFEGKRLDFYAWYPYNTTTVPVTAPSEIDDTIDDISKHPTIITYTVPTAVADQKDLLVAKASSVTDSPSTDTPVELTFSHKLTAVKFSIGVGTTCSSITLSVIPGTGILDMSTGEWPSVGNPAIYTITSPTFGSADANGQCLIDEEFTLMLIPQKLSSGATLTAETSAGTITASLAGQEWEPGKEVTYKLTDPAASFSVSDTLKVRFSPGNLQAVFAAPGTSFTWKFADNQWDYVGGDDGSVTVTETGNNFINGSGSVSDAGTVDLFGWSTNISATSRGIYNSKSITGYPGSFRDWGVAARSTLGSGWRTLSRDEWVYLLDTRDNDDNESTLYPRYCKATVNDVPGLVIFPDDYSHPSDVDAPISVNTPDADFNSNSWSDAAWTAMEGAGCVFLSAAGYRYGTSVSDVGSDGYYWSSTQGGSVDAYCLRFYISAVNPSAEYRRVGSSVRLVQDLP